MRSRRALAFALALVAAGPVFPAEASAQVVHLPRARPACVSVTVPDELSADAIDDLSSPVILCAGQRFRVKSKESKRVVRAPGIVIEKKKSKEIVHIPEGIHLAPRARRSDVPDVEELARQSGAAIKQKNETVIVETPDSSYRKEEEDTRIRGDDFDYDREESRVQTEEPGSRTEEEESEEEFDAHG